jgi:hypothetical protein
LARDPDADVTAIDLERDGQPEAVLRGDEAHLRLLDEQWVSVPLQDPGPGFVFFASTSLYKQVEGVFKIHLQEADFVGNIRDRIAKNPTNPQRFSEGDVDYPFMLSWESDGDDLISWSVERSTMEDLYPGDVWRMEYKLLDQAVAEELTGYDTGSPPSLAGLPARSVFPELSMTAPECVASPAQGAELLSCLQASAGDKTVAEWIERYGPGTSTRVESLPAECM